MLELHLICPYCGKDFPRYDNEVVGDEGAGRTCPRCGMQMRVGLYRRQERFPDLCDLDEKMNHDKEGVPLPPEKQAGKSRLDRGKAAHTCKSVVNSVVQKKKIAQKLTFLGDFCWWRRWESNPCPKRVQCRYLRVQAIYNIPAAPRRSSG